MARRTRDLVVDTAELTSVADEQERAASQIEDAKNDINGLVGGLLKDHGLITTALVKAMQELETARAAAADNTAAVSRQLADNLSVAAASYTEVDTLVGDNLDGQVQR